MKKKEMAVSHDHESVYFSEGKGGEALVFKKI